MDSLVAKEYSYEYLKQTYASAINPVTHTDNVPDLTSAMAQLNLYPPATRRPPGRPRKRRFFLRGETRVRVNYICLTLFYTQLDTNTLNYVGEELEASHNFQPLQGLGPQPSYM